MNRRGGKPSPEEVSGHWKNALRQTPATRAGIPAHAAGAPPSDGKIKRRRNLLARYTLVSGFFILTGLVFWAAFDMPDGSRPVAEVAGGPFKIEYRSDGVIPESYVREKLGDTSRMPPIFDVKRKLGAVPQIRSVSVRRLSGDRLLIEISERRAVARLNGLLDGKIVPRLVSAEGVLFEPVNMGDIDAVTGDTKTLSLRNMPLLLDARIEAGASYDRIEGFETIAAFLDLARTGYPQLYRDWGAVSLSDYHGKPGAIGAVIRVRPRLSAQIPDAAALKEIVFSPIDYAFELRKWSEYGGMDAIRPTLRNADRTKFPVYLLDLSMVNASNPRRPYMEPRLVPVPSANPTPPARSR